MPARRGPGPIRDLLESAILAPSADNRHRVRFRAVGDGLEIHLASALLPATGGYKRILELLSAGALLENLAVAASRHGWSARYSLFPEPDRPQLLCRVDWSGDACAEDPLWQAIPTRQTNRRLVYRGPALTSAQKEVLRRAADGQPGIELMWLDTPRLRGQVLSLMRQAESERFHNRELHADLFSAVRFDVGWRSSCAEGLPPGALGVERPFRVGFALLRHWPVMRALNLLGAHHLLGLRAADLPCRLAPHLGLIALKEVDDATLVAAGRVFERVWLAATQLGYALQPMPAAALYAVEGAVYESVPAALQHRLAQAWQRLLPGRRPVMLFRLGRAAPLGVRAGRTQVQHYWSGQLEDDLPRRPS